MKKYLKYVITAAVFAAAGLLLILSRMGCGFSGCVLLAAAAAAIAYMLLRMAGEKHGRAAEICRRILTCCIAIFIAAGAVTEFFIIRAARTGGGESDYAIVLGAGVNGSTPSRSLKARLETALEYANEHPEAVLIVSGGQGPGEDITEARCMYDWLTGRGVEPERILMEPRAENTLENINFSKEIIFEREPDFDGGICVITEGYHVLRAKLMASACGFEKISSDAAYNGLPFLTANYYVREAAGVWYYLLIR